MMRNVWQRKVSSAKKLCLLLVFTLTACSSTTEQIHPDLQTARSDFNSLSLQQSAELRIEKLQKAQQSFAVFADVEYVIKSNLLLADLLYANGHIEQAEQLVAQCKQLASVELYEHHLADCYLLEFRQTQNSQLLELLDVSKLNSRQLAYWYLYNNDLSNLAQQLTQTAKHYPADAAYLYYQLGYAQANIVQVSTALKFAQQHKTLQLVTDSLFLLSKLHYKQGDYKLSAWYFSLAQTSAKVNAPHLVESMQLWFSQHLQAHL
ncbi:hypothetical protein ACMZOO_05735 [Catenovulum sp. SX2]|uniref:hypothetical protein n=1 Tax=Catenovulum sp. SX2 TaxID=3398614 RepID=UPI003F83E63E